MIESLRDSRELLKLQEMLRIEMSPYCRCQAVECAIAVIPCSKAARECLLLMKLSLFLVWFAVTPNVLIFVDGTMLFNPATNSMTKVIACYSKKVYICGI